MPSRSPRPVRPAAPQAESPQPPRRKARPAGVTPARDDTAAPAETSKDEGVLESLGKAITAPVRDTAAGDERERGKR